MYLLYDSASPELSSQRAKFENSDGHRIPERMKPAPAMKPNDVPNLSATFGYTTASWTLGADLTSEYVCNLLNLNSGNSTRAWAGRRV